MTPGERIELKSTQVLEPTGLAYLSLQLHRQLTIALPLTSVQETLVVAATRLTLMPNVQPYLMGLLEHRSQVFWVLDLLQLLGFDPIDAASLDYPLAILRYPQGLLGLAVDRIGRVIRLPEEAIASPLTEPLPAAMVPYLRGVVRQTPPLYVLDLDALVAIA